jgi:hypothetical protein
VLIVSLGVGAPHTQVDGRTIAREAAKRGFVAASMQYANDLGGLSCEGIRRRATCSYNRNSTSSAVSRLCSRPKADCSRGIATAGHSLGGALAIRAKNFDSRVRATFTIGTANGFNTANCLNPGPADGGTAPRDRALRNSELRLYAGETEFPEQTAAARNQVTGQNCAAGNGTVNCLRTDGSGWYQVGNTEVADQIADHCYQLTPNVGGAPVQSCGAATVDPRFLNEKRIWSLGPSLDFLISRLDGPFACDEGATVLDQFSNGRVTLETRPFINGLDLTIVRPLGAAPGSPGFLNIVTNPAQQPAAFFFLLETLATTQVSLRQTAPGVLQLCNPELFPINAVMP